MERPFNFHRQVQIPFTLACEVLRDEPGMLLGMARDAALELASRDESLAHVMTAAPTPIVEHDIDVVLGQAKMVGEGAMMVPLIMSHVDQVPWFPVVDGEFEVVNERESEPPWCDLTFFGTYTPRMGLVGAAMDVAGGHNSVERTLESFFLSIVAHLMQAVEAEAQAKHGASMEGGA